MNLKEAIEQGKLEEFIAQEEQRGIGPVDKAELFEAIDALVKPQR